MQPIEELLKDLTVEQRQAATHVDGPLLIVAGAGSGKTRVITRRVAYLIGQGIPPAAILAITFTNKASGEMKHRVQATLDRTLRDFGRLDQPWPMICTFHSLCMRVLRHYAERVGLPPNFSIYDSADQNRLVKDAIKTLDLSTTNFTPGAVHSAISNAKNQLVTADQYASNARDFFHRQVARVYAKYQQLLHQNNALDFDDLLTRTAFTLRDHPDVLRELQDRFQYILIDEYQDTNHVQYVIAHALAMRHKNICVVGDPDQSIYAWRGADIRNILEFERDYPDAKVVRLERNYRSTKTILAIADKLIENNTQRKKKSLWTENEQGAKVKVILCQDERDEAAVVMNELKAEQESGRKWSDMAVFYRMNSLSRVVEEQLFKARIPYQVARGTEFYNRKEIKDVLAYLRVVANPADEVSLTRVVNVPTRGIGDETVKKMAAFAIGSGIPLFAAMEGAGQVPGLSTRAVNATKLFVEFIKSCRQSAQMIQNVSDADDSLMFESAKGRVQSVMEDVVKRSGIEALLRKSADPDLPELANVNELLSAAAEYDRDHPEGTLDEYLSSVSLLSDADHMEGAGGAITLMTLHAAKGLEFPVVAMVGLEEGCLPHARARGNPIELEEERRLCFVGITRAQQKLIMTKAQVRTMRGMRERTITSPFLNELPPEHLEIIDRTGLAFEREGGVDDPSPRTSGASAGPQFTRGQLVKHPTFGVGRIQDISEMGQHTRAVVEFNSAGRKTLILQYARLEAVG